MMTALLTLSLLVANATSAPASPRRSIESVLEQTRKNLTIDRTYAPGEKASFTLGLNEGARLKFDKADAGAGVTEILFRYEPEGLQVLYDDDSWTTITPPKRSKDWRIRGGGKAYMDCTTEMQLRSGKADVTFVAKRMSSREYAEFVKRDRERELKRHRHVLEWDDADTVEPIQMIMPRPDDPDLAILRSKYDLDKVVAGAGDDYEKLRRVLKWVHDRWSHNGDNTPSRSDPLTILAEAAQGKRFRCVEYAIVTAGCAQALGMPARTLALKRKDVETAEGGAGHLVAEVWLPSLKKWVFVDGQMDAIPEKDGVPLNAVEFQDAFAKNAPGLKIRSLSKTDPARYLVWVVPYLYYFDINIDQRLFDRDGDHSSDDKRYQPKGGKIMLVPKGAKQPTVFQRKTPIKNCTYVSNPKAFYSVPTTTAVQ